VVLVAMVKAVLLERTGMIVMKVMVVILVVAVRIGWVMVVAVVG